MLAGDLDNRYRLNDNDDEANHEPQAMTEAEGRAPDVDAEETVQDRVHRMFEQSVTPRAPLTSTPASGISHAEQPPR